ncbi:MAG: transglutaminase domain-containing protein [Pseudomonadota bacterium]|nr:transglutaminase domain-containing protein [Pseudomonadota bacterium]
MKKIPVFTLLFLILAAGVLQAENYTLKGDMDAAIRYELRERVRTGEGVKKMVLSFVVPQSFTSPTYSQKIDDFRAVFLPEPQERTEIKDKRGNLVLRATWTDVPDAVDVRLSCRADSRTHLTSLETRAPFPLQNLGPELAEYLQPTEQVQADNPRIRQLAAELTKGVKTEYDAVLRVVSWVVDHVRYVNPPVRYDALYSLETGKGNCQNYSHLSAAMLRSLGIPTRIVVGVTLNQPYNIDWKQGVLTFKMGQGRHSWIEAWFPDLGWTPFDPQNSILFVSNRFIRIETGLDNNEAKNDGLMRWSQVPGTPNPSLEEIINADFASDRVKVQGVRESYGPKNLLLAPKVLAQFKQVAVPPPPPPPPPPKEPRRLRYDVPFLFGNLDYPENVDFAFPRGVKSSGAEQFETQNNFLVETAEYVTSQRTQYAQVFVLKKPVKLKQVGLALHKFGGEGWLWIDLFKDDKGKPGRLLAASEMINLDQISPRPGYRWEDFDFSGDDPELMPGSYWIALGFTGSPIVNWFYTYGKSVGPVDGTRYRGVFDRDWSGALSYEFNFRIKGFTVRDL